MPPRLIGRRRSRSGCPAVLFISSAQTAGRVLVGPLRKLSDTPCSSRTSRKTLVWLSAAPKGTAALPASVSALWATADRRQRGLAQWTGEGAARCCEAVPLTCDVLCTGHQGAGERQIGAWATPGPAWPARKPGPPKRLCYPSVRGACQWGAQVPCSRGGCFSS